MNPIAKSLAPAFASVAASVAAAVAATAVSVALMGAAPAQAQSADQVKADFARAVYQHSATQVHNERPQPMLRAVVVLRIKLGDNNQWQAEVFRDNPDQPEMTKAALESVARLPVPVGLSPKARQILRNDGLVEAWLFENDGRFALKTLAKPQRTA
jgi:protein TonB